MFANALEEHFKQIFRHLIFLAFSRDLEESIESEVNKYKYRRFSLSKD
jgi:hypothetical protein